MTRTAFWLTGTLVMGIGLGLLVGPLLQAQAKGITRTLLLNTDLTGIDGREAVMGLAEVAPSVAAGRHYHDGDELGYLLEGTAVLEVEGQPPITLKAGDTYHIQARRVHDAKNTGTTPAKVLAIWIVEQGKPLATPVP